MSEMDWREGCKSISSKLEYVLRHNTFQDVTFLVGKGSKQEKIQAHQLVLILGSKIFENMLLPTCSKGDINIADVDPQAFGYLLKYLYTDKLETSAQVEAELLLNILYAATKFEIKDLASLCIELLKDQISEVNAIRILEYASVINSTDELTEKALKYILENATQIFKRPEFLTMKYENLCSILENDNLRIDELTLWISVIRWAEEESVKLEHKDLRYLLKRVVPLIRFPLMSAENFTLHVVPTGILYDPEIISVYKYFTLSPENQDNYVFQPLNFSRRKRIESENEQESEVNRNIVQHCEPVVVINNNGENSAEGSIQNRRHGLRSDIEISTRSKENVMGLNPTHFIAERLKDFGNGSWGCRGRFYEIWFEVDRPVNIVGLGFYGSYDNENPTYNVKIRIGVVKKQPAGNVYLPINETKVVVSVAKKGGIFYANFRRPVPVKRGNCYFVEFNFEGPSTCWATEELKTVAVDCGEERSTTFKFEQVPERHAHFQLPQIVFSL